MTDRLVLPVTVPYGDVDRTERMLLSRIFKLLQDAAILHANQFGTGTNAVATRGESWVLNRIEAQIDRYPAVGEALRIETWSTGVKGFKGYRDFRVFDADERLVLTASSLWLYVSLKTKSIIRVPREVAQTFPVGGEAAAFPALEAGEFGAPAVTASAVPITLRYSDFDVNEHVNNAAYFEFVQSALARSTEIVHPRRLRLKYAKEIPASTERIEVRVERAASLTRFSVEADRTVFAVGEAEA